MAKDDNSDNSTPKNKKSSKDKPDHREQDDDNVVRIPTLAERDRMRKNAHKANGKSNGANGYGASSDSNNGPWQTQYPQTYQTHNEPFFNLPPASKYIAGSFIVVHLIVNYMLPFYWQNWVLGQFSFIPGRFTGELEFTAFTLFTPVTYMWLHGGWMHLALNTIMMVAFGAGIEKWFGGKKLFLMLILCGLFGIAFHMIFYAASLNPVIGASGGISGFFAVILVMMNNGQLTGGASNRAGGILPFAILWIVISLISAFYSGFGNADIAWAVHIGGFLGGFLLVRPYINLKR